MRGAGHGAGTVGLRGWHGDPHDTTPRTQGVMMNESGRFGRFCGAQLPSGCIEWQGAVDRNGYGAFKIGGRKIGAHRVAVILSGATIPDDHEVCHHCDNKRCVNIDHLFVGTKSDNMRDAARKNRLPLPLKTVSKILLMSDAEVVAAYEKYGSVLRAAHGIHVAPAKLSNRLRAIRQLA